MRMMPVRWLPTLLFAFLFSTCPGMASSDELVDLELVLAVDISHSMDREEQRLQREGYIAALRHRDIIRAIRTGPLGRIAVAYMEWGDEDYQAIVVPWRTIASRRDADAFARELLSRPILQAKRTSISNALRVATGMILNNTIRSTRQIIDVSGDGPNNSGYPVAVARDAAVRQGIIINGLAFVIERPADMSSFFSVSDIDQYYRHCVIGGPGAFMMPVRNKNEFETSIRRKLLLEIARPLPTKRSLLHKAQFVRPQSSYDCLIGEKRWDDFQKE